jgi:hypothetical protein
VSNPQKDKGDRAEREVQGLIRDLTGWPARRQLGAGRKDDVGDISGVPDTCIQVASYADLTRAVREKVPECVVQQERAQATFGATFIRRPANSKLPSAYPYLVVAEQWATLARESSATPLATRRALTSQQDAA